MKRIYTIIAGALLPLAISAATPGYIDVSANHIDMNGADWSPLKGHLDKLAGGRDTVVRVLHIGDSHIQAEFVTNELRRLLQERYGNAGRGLISPLRLAGTNQPVDYTVTASPGTQFRQTRLLKLPWPVRPGVTGIAAEPQSDTHLTWKTTLPGHDIRKARIITGKTMEMREFDTPVDSMDIAVQAGNPVFGAILENGRPGLLYSAIGNNGATYNDYLLVDGFAEQTRVFAPALIILSMGTNEAFSYMTDAEIEKSVRTLIGRLRDFNPEAAMLMLTPMECQKNRNHGQRPLSPYYDILERNAEIAAMIRRVGSDLGVPVWDFYAVAGGHGSSDKWLGDKLMNKDRIHLLRPGYELEAKLLYDALLEQLD